AGKHTFKFGYFLQKQSEDVLSTFNGAYINVFYAQAYTPLVDAAGCNSIMAQNLAQFGKSTCQGRYGYFTVGGNGSVSNTGADTQTAHALYLQDAWQVGKYLTLNLGIRFDKEFQPP